LLVGDNKPIEPGLPAEIEIERFAPISARGLYPPASFLRARWSVRRAVARVQPDVVIAHFLTVNGWHAWLSGFHPYVVSLWGSDVFIAPKKWRVVGALARLSLRSADLVTANSESLLRAALELDAPADRSQVVQFGVDIDEFTAGPDPAAIRARLGLQGRRVVFSPRTIAPLYHPRVVVEALAQLPPDVVVLMSGFRARPDELQAVEQRAAALELTDRVTILPEIDQAEMADFYRLADVVVSVPESDSTAAVLLEALACEKPIVATDLASVGEWLRDLDPTTMVPVDDATATAAAILRVLTRSPEERADLGSRSRKIVVERADQARTLAQVEALYRNLVPHAATSGSE
jgi:glycosyltransferase involved in cell wall biosynthesis